MNKNTWLPIFFAIAACSWMPHWSCHYYRIETGSTFIVGRLNYSVFLSLLSMLFYSVLICLDILAVSFAKIRFIAALSSGVFHLTIGFIHVYRLIHLFHFEVFGYNWSMGASLREVLIVIPMGLACVMPSNLYCKT